MQGSGALRGSHGGSEGFCSPSSKNTHSSQPCGGILKPFGGLHGLVPQRGIWITHLKEHRHSALLARTNHGDWRWIRFTQRAWVVTHSSSSTSQMSNTSAPNSKKLSRFMTTGFQLLYTYHSLFRLHCPRSHPLHHKARLGGYSGHWGRWSSSLYM